MSCAATVIDEYVNTHVTWSTCSKDAALSNRPQ